MFTHHCLTVTSDVVALVPIASLPVISSVVALVPNSLGVVAVVPNSLGIAASISIPAIQSYNRGSLVINCLAEHQLKSLPTLDQSFMALTLSSISHRYMLANSSVN